MRKHDSCSHKVKRHGPGSKHGTRKKKTTESAWTVKSCQCHHYVELDTTLMIDWFWIIKLSCTILFFVSALNYGIERHHQYPIGINEVLHVMLNVLLRFNLSIMYIETKRQEYAKVYIVILADKWMRESFPPNQKWGRVMTINQERQRQNAWLGTIRLEKRAQQLMTPSPLLYTLRLGLMIRLGAL